LHQGNFNEADKKLQNILSLKSEHPRMLRTAGRISSWFGRYQQGIELCKRAVELDPLQVRSYSFLRDAYLANGQFREAEIASRTASELTKPPTMIIRELILNRKLDEAMSLINSLSDEDYKNFCYTLLYFAKGQKGKSDEYLQKFNSDFKKSPYPLAQLYAFRNEINEAFHYLEMGIPKENMFLAFKYMQRGFSGYAELKADPFFIPLRKEVRFRELTRKLNFPE
jgi:tetratricopeptide (TPR) repeat protein